MENSQLEHEFQIVAIRIDKNNCSKKLLKDLSEEYYFFDHRYKPVEGNIHLLSNNNHTYNVFGTRVFVQAIVGMNGSGKSSLLELIYRIINNFSAVTERGFRRRSADKIYFIKGLWADLFYAIDDNLLCISCQGNDVKLFKNGKEELSLSTNDSQPYIWKNQKELAKLSKDLCYSIVTNYSVQSLISSDYEEDAMQLNPNVAQPRDGLFWLSSLFIKNDGYLTPIVLNPFRNEDGNINMQTERDLTLSRLEAILIFYKDKSKQFIDGYKLNRIHYTIDYNSVVEKILKSHFGKDAFFNEDSFRERVWNLNETIKELNNNGKKCFATIILEEMGYVSIDMDKTCTQAACTYLVYKVLSIASKYPSYSKFAELGDIDNVDKVIEKNEGYKEKLLKELISQINKDNSHITIKIKQVKNFLDFFKESPEAEDDFSDFNYDYYFEKVFSKNKGKGLQEIMTMLPPSFFKANIFFDRTEKNKIISNEPIPIYRMSSGERQFLYMISTYIYHIRNILSIQNVNRVKYRNINLIFDELEICFHPEYQRVFINKLLSVIRQFHFTNSCSFNIIMATHSPFILSDIPKDNILYLEKGYDVSASIKVNPFGANINDVLAQSFFLKHGFVGEFAQNKINSLTEYLLEGKDSKEWNEKNAKYFIENVVGEPIIKRYLQDMLLK